MGEEWPDSLRQKVNGNIRFVADIRLPGMLWGEVVRSQVAHGEIVEIDSTGCQELAGCRAVITGEIFGGKLTGRRIQDMPILANGRVRFIGERIAAVAAEDLKTAKMAAHALRVKIRVIPAMLDVEQSRAGGATIIHPDFDTYVGRPDRDWEEPNILTSRSWNSGDVAEGFRQADHVVEQVYTTSRVHHGYLEPHACLARVYHDGSAEFWLTHKEPFAARQQLASLLGLLESQVVVHAVPIGGDFGGKGSLMDAPIAYQLSLQTQCPVMIQTPYQQELAATNSRHASVIRLKTGIKKDGTLVAHEATAIFDSGAYAAHKPAELADLPGSTRLGGNYRIPNVSLRSEMVYTNHLPSGHMRAPGYVQAVFAMESHMDVIARSIDMDPLKLRLKNVIREGDVTPAGYRWARPLGYEVLMRASELSNWELPRPRHFGRGIALADHPSGKGRGTVEVGISSGGFYVRTIVPDTGAGAHSMIRSTAAKELEVPAGEIEIRLASTKDFGYDGGVGGSRGTHIHGRATVEAANQLKRALLAEASRQSDMDPSSFHWKEGAVFDQDGTIFTPQSLAPLGLVKSATYQGTEIGQATAFCAQVAEVQVDPETGVVRIERVYSVHDAGSVLNPMNFRGQVAGAIAQGIGYALMELLETDHGKVTALNLADHGILAHREMPPIEIDSIVDGEGPGPNGAKGIGETPIMPVAAAIANAIVDAVGVRIVDLPITAERVLEHLQKE